MGHYTEFHFEITLEYSAPCSDLSNTDWTTSKVIDLIYSLLNREEITPSSLPDHAFFKCERWRSVFHSHNNMQPPNISSKNGYCYVLLQSQYCTSLLTIAAILVSICNHYAFRHNLIRRLQLVAELKLPRN